MFAFYLCHWFQYFKQHACNRLLITLLLANTSYFFPEDQKNLQCYSIEIINLKRSKIRETIVWLICKNMGDTTCNLSIFLEELLLEVGQQR